MGCNFGVKNRTILDKRTGRVQRVDESTTIRYCETTHTSDTEHSNSSSSMRLVLCTRYSMFTEHVATSTASHHHNHLHQHINNIYLNRTVVNALPLLAPARGASPVHGNTQTRGAHHHQDHHKVRRNARNVEGGQLVRSLRHLDRVRDKLASPGSVRPEGTRLRRRLFCHISSFACVIL